MDAKLLPARLEDVATRCERAGTPCFLGFLTESEAAAADDYFRRRDIRYSFFGGYDGADRRYLACLPDWCEEPDWPIMPFTLSYRDCDKLSHRDFLGALMALGITRESVGDILVEDGRTVIFLSRDIAKYAAGELLKVGNVGVTVSEGFSLPLPQLGEKTLCSDTVASARLDCVVGAICSLSRSGALDIIAQGRVSVNSLCCEKPARSVAAGDKITVRGKGRFEIVSAEGLSKKGRVILKYNKFK